MPRWGEALSRWPVVRERVGAWARGAELLCHAWPFDLIKLENMNIV